MIITTLYKRAFNAFVLAIALALFVYGGQIAPVRADQAPTLIKDINPTGGSGIERPLVVGNWVYFGADDGSNGFTLWRTDGLTTERVAVQNGGAPVQLITLPEITTDGHYVYFIGCQSVSISHNAGINCLFYRTDGTAANTIPFNMDYLPSVQRLVFAKPILGAFYFAIQDTTTNYAHGQIWKADPETGNTVLFKDFGMTNELIGEAQALNGKMYFTVMNGAYNTDGFAFRYELWSSDGTPEGTTLFKGAPTNMYNYYGKIKTANGLLFFTPPDTSGHSTLWQTDGTPEGTVITADLAPGAELSPHLLSAYNNILYFFAGNLTKHLYATSGKASGVEDLGAFDDQNLPDQNLPMTSLGNQVFFIGQSGYQYTLYKTDGTAAGTTAVVALNTDYTQYNRMSPDYLASGGSKVYFANGDAQHGTEMWASDGTTQGTGMVFDINPGAASSSPNAFAATATRLFFAADDGIHGDELWMDMLVSLDHAIFLPKITR